jgi:glycosyltransferase involved in cell wall biosynthesis
MCVAATGQASTFTKQLRDLGVSHSVIRAGPDFNPLLAATLWRETRSFRPDLVHTHLIHADLHGQLAARLAGTPGVSSVHSTPSFYRREPYRAARRIAGRSTRLTIAISEHVSRFVETLGLGRPGTVRVIPYGVNASDWPAPDAERASARAGLGVKPSDVAVGIAARLIPNKGHSFLLKAHAKASRDTPRLLLMVAGDGPLRAELEQEASALDARVRFLGFVSDMRSFMNACDVLAFPTQPELNEGFGLAALEAMAAARPVIATAVGSLPEVVRTEETGLLVDPRSVDGFAAGLARLADDASLREAMGQRGHERARRVFSLEAMVNRTVAAYEEALRLPTARTEARPPVPSAKPD